MRNKRPIDTMLLRALAVGGVLMLLSVILYYKIFIVGLK